ncbi:MAG TPA: hypothetical protein VIJ27_13595 [Mucilaginibacter sp.]
MNTLKQRIFTNWHFSRFLRLGMGLWMLVWAAQTKDWSIGLFSGLFLFMAISNTGCCGAQGCALPGSDSLNEINKD